MVRGIPGAPAEPQATSGDIRTVEHLAHLKSTAEKMMQEHSAANADLQILRSKLERSEQKVQVLEVRLQEVSNESSTLKAKHGEDVKSLEVLVSKHVATKSMFDKIADTLHQLETELQQVERDKAAFEDKSVVRLSSYEQSKGQIAALQMTLTGAANTATQREADICKLNQEAAKLEEWLASETSAARKVLQQKEEGQRQLDLAEETLQANKCLLKSTQDQLAFIHGQLAEKTNECMKLQADYKLLVRKTTEVSLQHQDLLSQLSTAVQFTDNIRQERGQQTAQALNLERTLGLATTTNEEIQGQCREISLKAWQEHQAKERAFQDLQEICMRYRQLDDMRSRLQQELEASKWEILELQTSLESAVKEAEDHAAMADFETRTKFEKLEAENMRSENIIQYKTEKEAALESAVHNLLGDKVLELRCSNMVRVLRKAAFQEQLVRSMCYLKLENVKAVEHLNSQLEEKALEIDILTRKNAGLLLVLKLCLERENNLQTACLKKSHFLDVTLQKLRSAEERLKQEIENLTLAENLLLERKQQSDLQLEAKQAELNKHLKEIAARNNKEMSDFRMKLEAETREAIMEGEVQVKKLLAAHDMEKKNMITGNKEELAKRVSDISKERRNELQKFQEQQKLLLLEEQKKVGKLQEQSGLVGQNFGFDIVKEKELDVKLTKCEETLRDKVFECLYVQEEHQTEIASLHHFFHHRLEEGTRGILIWKSKCKAMALEIQQLRDKLQEEKLRYGAEKETWEDNYRNSVARIQETFSRQKHHGQVVDRKDTIIQEQGMSEVRLQGLRPGPFGHMNVPNQETDTNADVVSVRGSKYDKVVCYEHGVSTSSGRKRFDKRKRNLDAPITIDLVKKALKQEALREPFCTVSGAELEGLCSGGGLDPYQLDT